MIVIISQYEQSQRAKQAKQNIQMRLVIDGVIRNGEGIIEIICDLGNGCRDRRDRTRWGMRAVEHARVLSDPFTAAAAHSNLFLFSDCW